MYGVIRKSFHYCFGVDLLKGILLRRRIGEVSVFPSFFVSEGQKLKSIRNPYSLVRLGEVVKSPVWFKRSDNDRVGIEI